MKKKFRHSKNLLSKELLLDVVESLLEYRNDKAKQYSLQEVLDLLSSGSGTIDTTQIWLELIAQSTITNAVKLKRNLFIIIHLKGIEEFFQNLTVAYNNGSLSLYDTTLLLSHYDSLTPHFITLDQERLVRALVHLQHSSKKLPQNEIEPLEFLIVALKEKYIVQNDHKASKQFKSFIAEFPLSTYAIALSMVNTPKKMCSYIQQHLNSFSYESMLEKTVAMQFAVSRKLPLVIATLVSSPEKVVDDALYHIKVGNISEWNAKLLLYEFPPFAYGCGIRFKKELTDKMNQASLLLKNPSNASTK